MRKILLSALAVSLLVPTGANAQRDDRHEPLEAWEALRETNGDLFRRPEYVAPRGRYTTRVSVGDELDHAFYAPSYRIEDFAAYRLPRPADNQHYVRYDDDVLRVNVRTGRVIKVYRDFFL